MKKIQKIINKNMNVNKNKNKSMKIYNKEKQNQ